MANETQVSDGADEVQESTGSSVDNADPGKPDGDGKPSNDGQPSNDQEESKDDSEDGGDESKTEESVEFSEFELPEGIEVDETLLGNVTPLFKELGLNQDQAQKLVSTYAEHMKETNQGHIDAHNAQVQQWGEDLKADKEIGGDKYEENMSIARAGIEKFGDPELADLLNETGLGNHPLMAKFAWRIGKLTLEDAPGGSGGGAGEEKSLEERFYGKSQS